MTRASFVPIISSMNSLDPLTHRFLLVLFTRTRYAWLVACVTIASILSGCDASPVTLSVTGPPETASVPDSSPTNSTASVDEIASTELTNDSPPASPPQPAGDAGKKPVMIDSKQLVGRWRDSFYGQRTLTINADGTAMMLLELDFAGRLLYGKQVEFDLEWTLAESKLTFQIKSGRPMESAQSAIKAWGETLVYSIQEADETQLRVLCSDGTTVYTFRRLPADAEGAERDTTANGPK